MRNGGLRTTRAFLLMGIIGLGAGCDSQFDAPSADWLVEQGGELRHFEGHTDWVSSVALSADGRRALSGSRDQTVRLWDTATGQELKHFEGHTEPVNSVAFSADGRRALSGSLDKTVRLWDTETGQELKHLQGHTATVSSVVLSADGRRALSGSSDKTVRLWDTESLFQKPYAVVRLRGRLYRNRSRYFAPVSRRSIN